MADISKDDEYMEYGVDIWYLLETVKDSASDIGDSFADYPKNYGQPAGLVERLEGYENGQSHQDITGCLKITLCLHLAETQSCSH